MTPAMTSLTGASGEDFASVLRSLGYRAERRPKPAEAAAALGGARCVRRAGSRRRRRRRRPSQVAENAARLSSVKPPRCRKQRQALSPRCCRPAEAPPAEPAIAVPEELPPRTSRRGSRSACRSPRTSRPSSRSGARAVRRNARVMASRAVIAVRSRPPPKARQQARCLRRRKRVAARRRRGAATAQAAPAASSP